MPVPSVPAGSRPGRRGPFLLVQARTQRIRPQSRVPALRYGQPCTAQMAEPMASRLRPSAAMARVVPAPTPCGRACGVVLAGWWLCRRTQPLRNLTRRGCSSVAPAARSRVLRRTPQVPRHRLPRSMAAGSRTVGSCSWPTVLWPALRHEQEGRSAAGPRPGQQAKHRHEICKKACAIH